MPLEELVETFSLDRVHGSPAVFDEEKLKWMNSQYLRALSNEDLWQRIQPFLTAAGLDFSDAPEDWKNKTLDVFKSSMETLVDAVALYQNMSDAHFQVDEEACAEVLSWDTTKAAMEVWLQGLKDLSGDYLSEEDFLSLQDKVKSDLGVKGKHLFMPLRVAVIGKPQGAEMKLLVPLLAKSSLRKRVEIVLEKI